MPPALVIFDCDGVLVDTEPVSNAMLAEALVPLGLSLSVSETRRAFVGLSWPDVAAEIETMTGAPLPEGWLEQVIEREHEAFRRELNPVPGVRGVLEMLAEEGRPCCVASSGSIEKMHLTLGTTGLLPLVHDVLFSAHMVERGKPYPDLFLHAAGGMGHAPETCTVIEDSVPGVTAAAAAGMRALAYAGDPETDGDALRAAGGEVFASMAELPGLLGVRT
ncbi:MAG: HAD family hydrolase [Alphaproteobacteria bacterium]